MGRVLLIHFLPAVCWCIRPREKNSGVANIHGKAQEHARRVKEREREAAGNLSGNTDEYELKSLIFHISPCNSYHNYRFEIDDIGFYNCFSLVD